MLEIPSSTTTTVPQPLTQKQRDMRRDNTHRNHTLFERRRESYLSRPFIAWDGEGITSGQTHDYVTLANSRGARLRSNDGTPLKTFAIFDFLIREAIYCGKQAIHVIYGGGYDFNKWCHYMPKECMERLYETGSCYVSKYRVEWRRGKSFRITDRDLKATITIYDVVSFFQCAFVKACDDYLGNDWYERARIVENKAKRSQFTLAELDAVDEYNYAELVNLVRLMDELRIRLDRVDLRLGRWDGPGAIAAVMLKSHGIKQHIVKAPDAVRHAARRAYTGGRFELVRCGHVDGPVYEYDVNSAYPHALRYVPSLAHGRWVRLTSTNAIAKLTATDFAMVRCTYNFGTSDPHLPQPLFFRTDNGRVTYTTQIPSNWYWTPEVCAARDYVMHGANPGGTLEEHEAWVFKPFTNDDVKPFAWLTDTYEQRRQLKAAGDGAHVGLKLGINSLYGKTVQQVGASFENGEWKLPSFHCLEWGGYVTSYCRSMVLRAAMQNLGAVIAFETDALFTSEPLTLDEGTDLGQWEPTEFTSMTYVQSGFYFAVQTDGKMVSKTRGVDRGSLARETVIEAMGRKHAADRYVNASLTRFISYGLAQQTHGRWGTWYTANKLLATEPSGKRMHMTCDQCDDTQTGLTRGVWHKTLPFPSRPTGESNPFPIEWENDYREYESLTEVEETKEAMAHGYYE